MIRRHYLVSGRVQGVGFRYFVYGKAQSLGIVGRVRNLEDGRVEILAAGPEAAMKEFDSAVVVGPKNAIVNICDRRDLGAEAGTSGELLEFSIVADGEEPWFIDS